MAVLSKLFVEFLNRSDCADFTHSGACTANAAYKLPLFFISNARYYGPIVFLPVLAKFRNLNRGVLEKTLRYYMGCVLIGTAEGWISTIFICIFKYLRGHYSYYTFLFLPGCMGGLSILLAPPRVRRLHTLAIFQCTIESILMRRKNILSRIIANSKLVQALLFMSSSSIILHAKRIGAYKGFWLLEPDDERRDPEESKKCTHKEKNCSMHFVKGIRSYFVFGITLDFLKAFFSRVPKSTVGLFGIIVAKLRNIKLNSAALLASYIGIYRLTHCYFNRSMNASPTVNHLAAGFLAGICYIFMPKLTWLSYALVICVQILWKFFGAQLNDETKEKNVLWSSLTKIPLENIFFPICLGHLIHAYCLESDITSNLAQIIINNTTNFHAREIFERKTAMEKFLTAKQ